MGKQHKIFQQLEMKQVFRSDAVFVMVFGVRVAQCSFEDSSSISLFIYPKLHIRDDVTKPESLRVEKKICFVVVIK